MPCTDPGVRDSRTGLSPSWICLAANAHSVWFGVHGLMPRTCFSCHDTEFGECFAIQWFPWLPPLACLNQLCHWFPNFVRRLQSYYFRRSEFFHPCIIVYNLLSSHDADCMDSSSQIEDLPVPMQGAHISDVFTKFWPNSNFLAGDLENGRNLAILPQEKCSKQSILAVVGSNHSKPDFLDRH